MSHENMVPAIAAAVGYQFESDSREPRQQLLDYFTHKSMLLVLDNFEHLQEGAGLVTDILNAGPDIKVLVTSREALNLQAEHLWLLRGLDTPADEALEVFDDYSAVQLFVERTWQVRPDFSPGAYRHEIVRICRLVDGLPLALELAASWTRLLSPQAICDEIQRSIDFLATNQRDVPARHRSMRAVFDRSWSLLSETERMVFCRLSVFRGGFTPEAAEQVTGAALPLLASLIDKSLLRLDASGRGDLHELLRQYAEEQLEKTGDENQVRDAHMHYYVAALHQREADLKGRRQLEALNEIEADFENVQVAWEWAVRERAYPVIDRAVMSLGLFCSMRDHWARGFHLFDRAREQLAPRPGEAPHPVYGKVLSRHNHGDQVTTHVEQALTIAREHHDRIEEGECLASLSWVMYGDKKHEQAITLIQESLAIFREVGDPYFIAHRLANLSTFYMLTGALEQTQRYIDEALTLARNIGDKFTISSVLNVAITFMLIFQGNYEAAERNLAESVELAREVGARARAAWDVLYRGIVLFLMARIEEVRPHVEMGSAIAKDINDPPTIGFVKALQALVIMITERDYATAWDYLQEYDEASAQHPWGAGWGWMNASAACGLGDFEGAIPYIVPALKFAIRLRSPVFMILNLPVAAVLLAHRGEIGRAAEVLSLAWNHPYAPRYFELDPLITRLREDLENELGAEVYRAAWERGRSLDLDAVVQELLAEFRPDDQADAAAMPFPAQVLEANAALPESLTQRELEVLALICTGRSNQEIAEKLVVGVSTVRKHINHLYSKLDVTSRSQAILRAQALGLV
jgi:predicted ATPase/DNA-binding CsgD family transcriptional regulator